MHEATSYGKIIDDIDRISGVMVSAANRIGKAVEQYAERVGEIPHVARLRRAVEILQKCPTYLIELIGHENSLTLDRAKKENERNETASTDQS